jgi:dTDP-4-amino-4,6-dideoxygalactose transaminase
VFVPAHTYFATVSPVLEVGATPVFVDVDPARYTMDLDDLTTKVDAAEDPTAIGVTHMHGQPADIDPILDIAETNDLLVIEDAAQAHGAEYKGQKAGSFGDVGCFSFYPSKNMTVGGDGGMIVTDDDDLARRAKMFRNHGRDEEGVHRVLGLNYRLDETNAVVGRKQLELLDDWNDGRRRAARLYDDLLDDVDEVTIPSVADDATHVYHHYPVQVTDRDAFIAAMDDAGVQTGIHYETPAHQHPAVTDRVDPDIQPRAEALCDRIVSLPMHPRLEDREVEYVCDQVRAYYR